MCLIWWQPALWKIYLCVKSNLLFIYRCCNDIRYFLYVFRDIQSIQLRQYCFIVLYLWLELANEFLNHLNLRWLFLSSEKIFIALWEILFSHFDTPFIMLDIFFICQKFLNFIFLHCNIIIRHCNIINFAKT